MHTARPQLGLDRLGSQRSGGPEIRDGGIEMHLQVRCAPAASPADVRKFLDVLARADINVAAVGGGSLEHGGNIAIACADVEGHDETTRAKQVLTDAGYKADIVREGSNPQGYLYVGEMKNAKGELMREVDKARTAAGSGYLVDDIAVGVPTTDGGVAIYPVQVFLRRRRV